MGSDDSVLSEPRSSMIVPPGTLLNGRYRVVRVLGAGAFGRVYLGEDMEQPGTQLAIKELLSLEFPSAEEQRDAANWFKREVSTLLTLDHPGIPAIHGYWTANRLSGPLYLAMDFIPGKTVADLQAESGGRVSRRKALMWAIGICDVLDYLHSRTPPFIFRDLKPANVMVDSQRNLPVLIDFGLARQLAPTAGTAVGTWGYVPYEQVLGKAEPRSDVYGLGAVLHSILTGRQPDVEYRRLLRAGQDLEGALRSLFPPLNTLLPGVPAALAHVVATATAFSPDDRFLNARAMSAALHEALTAPGGIAVSGPVVVTAPSSQVSSRSAEVRGPKSAALERWPDSASHSSVSKPTGSASLAGASPEVGTVLVPGSAISESMARIAAVAVSSTEMRSPDPAQSDDSVEESPVRMPSPVNGAASANLAHTIAGMPSLEPIVAEPQPSKKERSVQPAPPAQEQEPSIVSTGAEPIVADTPSRSRWNFRKPKSQPLASEPETITTPHITVSPSGKAQCRTISEALQLAHAGSQIDVEPGIYSESLVIDKPVAIVGVGAVEDVIVESMAGACVLMQTDTATIQGLTLRCRPPAGGGRFYTVNIPWGRLVLEGCQIISYSLACIAIHGASAHPVLRRCKLWNPMERAVSLYDHARGLFEDCDIMSGTLPVQITTQANPTLRHCLIHHGRFGGVLIKDYGRGRLEECEIADNGHHGVAIRHNSSGVILYCRITRNGWNAISVTDQSGAVVEHCDLSGNKRSTWDIKQSALPRVDRVANIEA